jgi:hypothetical protein
VRQWVIGAGIGLLVLAGVGPGPLRAHGGALADDWAASAPGLESQCPTPPGQSSEGQSVRNDVSPPLRSITPVPTGLSPSVYLVPVPPTEGCPSPAAAAPVIRAVEPAAGPVGSEVTIRGSGFSPTENAIYIGEGYVPHLRSADGVSLTFLVPASLEPPCRFATPPCRIVSIATPAGAYQVAVVNSTGVSNRLGFTVVAAGEP